MLSLFISVLRKFNNHVFASSYLYESLSLVRTTPCRYPTFLHPFNMTYYDPLRARRRLSSLQPTPYIAGTGGPYMRMPEFPPLMSGQPLGAQPIPQFGTPRAVGFPPHVAAPNQQFAQQPFANQVPAQAGSIHGTSPAAQYMAATEAAGNQSGMPGGEPVTGPPGMFSPAAAYYNQQPANPYNPQGVPAMAAGGAATIPGMG